MRTFTKTLFAAAALAATSAPAFAEIAAPDTSPVCTPISVTVYFADGDARLTNAAATALRAQATDLNGCAITEVAATAVSSDGDASLSEARSASVFAELTTLGIVTSEASTSIGNTPEGRFISTNREVQLTMTTVPATVSS